MIKLTNILKEIGDASAKPYEYAYFGDFEGTRIYGFDTENYPYTVELQYEDLDHYEDDENALGVRFYVSEEDKPDYERDDITTNKGELYRVMATIIAILKKDLEAHPQISILTFTPVKRPEKTADRARLNLYVKYIKNAFPNASIAQGPGKSIEVRIK